MRSDRRGFFQNVAGAAAAVAGAEAVRRATRPATVEAAAPRPFSSGHFAVELDGQMAGFVISVDGGHAVAEVVEEAPGESCFTRKNLGRVSYGEIALAFGTGMSGPFYQWLRSVCECELAPRSGALLSADFNFKEVARQSFQNALITEIGFPALDASSKDPATMTVKFAPESTQRQKGSGEALKPCAASRKQKKWLAANFRLTIDGLDCSKVSKIDAFAIKQQVAEREPARLEIPNLVVTLPESAAESFFEWHEDFVIQGNSGDESEKKGLLEFLTPNLADTLLTVEFQHLGIFKLTPEKLEAGSEQIRRVTAEMYCEEMTFDFAAIATGC
jgi:hypothetical protein